MEDEKQEKEKSCARGSRAILENNRKTKVKQLPGSYSQEIFEVFHLQNKKRMLSKRPKSLKIKKNVKKKRGGQKIPRMQCLSCEFLTPKTLYITYEHRHM